MTEAAWGAYSPLMSATVDSFFDEYARRYTERDVDGVTNLCLWPFLAIRKGKALHMPDRDAVASAPFSPACQAPVSPGRFVAVPQTPAPPLTSPATESEMPRADGARLRRRAAAATLPLAAVVRAFLEVA